MNIRRANKEDIPQILNIKKETNEARFLKRIEQSDQDLAAYLVIDKEGKILGSVFLQFYGSKQILEFPNIEDLFIAEDMRGQGFGTKLLIECFKISKSRGFEKIGLSVNPTLNKEAKNLYERMGFTIQNKEPYMLGILNGHENWVVDMVKNL